MLYHKCEYGERMHRKIEPATHINKRIGSVVTGKVSNTIYPSYVLYMYSNCRTRTSPSRYYMASHGLQQVIFYKGLINTQKTTSPYDVMSKMIWSGGDPTTSVVPETNVNWGFYCLNFHLQLIQQSRLNNTITFGNGGWNIITMIHMVDRLRKHYDNDDATWLANRTSLGMSSSSATEAQNIDNNSKLLIQTSWITKRDQHNFFTIWGIKFDTQSSNQVAAYGFPAVHKVYFPYVSAGNAFWTTDTVGTLPVDTTTRTIPRIPLNFTTTPDDVRQASYDTPMTLTAYVGTSGTVNFKVNGVTIPGCNSVTAATRTADQVINGTQRFRGNL